MIRARRILIMVFFLIFGFFTWNFYIITNLYPTSGWLAEAFGGEAVFIYDPETGENHKGKTPANNDENRGSQRRKRHFGSGKT